MNTPFVSKNHKNHRDCNGEVYFIGECDMCEQEMPSFEVVEVVEFRKTVKAANKEQAIERYTQYQAESSTISIKSHKLNK